MSLGKDTILDKVREIADRVCTSEGIELVDAELLGGGGFRVLRLFIDRPAGVTHSDCELVSKEVGTILDMEDTIPGARYTLEVSSPGVERKLSKPQDFQRFTGQKVKIKLREPVDNQRNWEGTLAGFAEGAITLEPAPGKVVKIALDQVEKANLKFEW